VHGASNFLSFAKVDENFLIDLTFSYSCWWPIKIESFLR
jgi:hypothetical protein